VSKLLSCLGSLIKGVLGGLGHGDSLVDGVDEVVQDIFRDFGVPAGGADDVLEVELKLLLALSVEECIEDVSCDSVVVGGSLLGD